jgi:hypothetical protein
LNYLENLPVSAVPIGSMLEIVEDIDRASAQIAPPWETGFAPRPWRVVLVDINDCPTLHRLDGQLRAVSPRQ